MFKINDLKIMGFDEDQIGLYYDAVIEGCISESAFDQAWEVDMRLKYPTITWDKYELQKTAMKYLIGVVNGRV